MSRSGIDVDKALPPELPLRRRAAVLLLWLALALAAGWQIAHTRFTADLSAFLPASPDPRQRVLIEQLQSGAPARTLLIGIDGGDAHARAEASRALAAALRASGLFEQVQNGQTRRLRRHRHLVVRPPLPAQPGGRCRALHARRAARGDRRDAVAARHAGRQRDQAAAGPRPDRRDAAHRREPDPGQRAAHRGRRLGLAPGAARAAGGRGARARAPTSTPRPSRSPRCASPLPASRPRAWRSK